MSKMQKLMTTVQVTIAIAAVLVAAGGGFKAGGYWEANQYEKRALAHDCATLDPKTLAFSWRLPISMDIAMEAMPDIAPVKSKKAVAK
jgi:hypothetical protein